ncbi:MAG: hypothetical protein ABI175_24160, partial [Polyangiales bacterium]
MSDRIAPEDPVEAEMGDETVLRRDKVVARNLALICLLMFVGFGAVSIAYMRGWGDRSALIRWLTYLMVPFSAWIGLTKSVLRTVVTRREVHIRVGFRDVHVPIASIGSVRVMNDADKPVAGRELYYPAGGLGILLDWRDEHGK